MNQIKNHFNRRSFVKGLGGVGLISLTQSPYEILTQSLFDSMQNPDRLSWKAYRGTSFEGAWQPTEIEGKIPERLNGKIFRIGPGAKKVGQTLLSHYFDGDAYLTAFTFKQGQVSAQSKFIETAERVAETQAKKMLYHDYGTKCPERSKGFKNPPNIHFVQIGDQHLALSEAAHPYAVNPNDLSTLGSYDFKGALDSDLSFTAHPKKDPVSGDTFAYGISRSLSPKLKILKIDSKTGKLSEIASLSLGGFFPIHDMMLTKNYLVFVVSPLKVNLMGAALGTKPIAELLEYQKNDPLRIFVVRKDGQGTPFEIKSNPSGMVFHHCNAYEDDSTGRLIFDSVIADDDSAFKLFKNWAAPDIPAGPVSWITRFEIDLKEKKLLSRQKISDGIPTDFPCIDPRALGQRMNYYYALEAARGADPLAFNQLVCWDIKNNKPLRVTSSNNQIWGEPLFVPYPDSQPGDDQKAWIIHLGYDGGRDQSFLDIRSALTLNLEARIWLGQFIPLSFHGSFNTEGT